MENENPFGNALERAAAEAEVMDMQDVLIEIGRQQAFGYMASKGAAAQAQILSKIKRQKSYKRLGMTWDDFCMHHAGMSRPTAEAMIKRLEEFGATYFQLSEVVRVSPDTFRQLEGSIEDGVIVYGGDRVEITRNNAERIREIVEASRAEVRRAKQAEADAKQRAKEMTAARDEERERADQLDKAERKRLADEENALAGLSENLRRLRKAQGWISRAMVEITGVRNSPDLTEQEHSELRDLRDMTISQVATASGFELDPMTAELVAPMEIGGMDGGAA